MEITLAEALIGRHNFHRPLIKLFEERTGLGWHDPTPGMAAARTHLSVVIPARNTAYSLPTVLDHLAAQDTAGRVEVIVIDDASTDQTPEILREHPAVDIAHKLPSNLGSAAARNLGTHLANADTVVYVDSDMVLSPHVLADFAARAEPDMVLVGFRHNIDYQNAGNQHAVIPTGEPDLNADHRVLWNAPAGVPMFYSGQIYQEPLFARPLTSTDDFIDLGCGEMFHDWDLPRMVVTALVAAPKATVIDVGGFDAGFDASGWGCEDTHLGAALIAAGCLVVPLRQARGWHINPPDSDAAWAAKFATVPDRMGLYRELLTEPAPIGRTDSFRRRATALLDTAEVLR